MLEDKKDQLCDALEAAADEVRQQPIHEHHQLVAAAGAAAVPSWLISILQLLGPAVLQALQQWLSTIVPTPPQPPKPA